MMVTLEADVEQDVSPDILLPLLKQGILEIREAWKEKTERSIPILSEDVRLYKSLVTSYSRLGGGTVPLN